MRSGSVTDQPMVELFCSLAAQRASGRLELRQGKKRRGFYFEGGRISLTKSNLKSESLTHLLEQFPGEAESALLARQGRQRVMGALATKDGDYEFVANVPPSERRPTDLLAVVWSAIDRLLEPAAIDARLTGLGNRFPLCAPQGVALEDLPFDGVLRDFVYTLDGTRSLDEVLEFQPTDPELARRALYLALITGVIAFQEEESGVFASVTAGDGDPPTPPPGGLDLSALIASEVGEDEDPFGDGDPEPETDDAKSHQLRARLRDFDEAENHFEVLGVHWDAPEPDYRKAYFALANELHPDRWQGRSPEVKELAGEVFARVAAAWEVLGDRDSRKAYIDREIHGIKSEEDLAMEKVQAILAAEDIFKAGLALYRRGKIQAAHDRFKEAHDMVPEEAEFRAYYGYTTWHLNQGRDDMVANDGHQMVEKAVESHVKLDGGLVLLGLIYKGKGQSKRAMASLKAAMEMNPNNPDAELQLRRLAAEMQRTKAKKEEDERKSTGLFGRLFGKKK